MNKGIIGGIISLVIGGTSFAISKSDLIANFSRETGMTKEQAQQYVNNAQNNLDSFSNIGTKLVQDGQTILTDTNKIDCENYTYTWTSPNLGCTQGTSQLLTIGNSEVALGECYEVLGGDLGSAVKAKISECISDIDNTNASYDLPIAAKLLNSSTLADQKNTNSYNKSVLLTALNK